MLLIKSSNRLWDEILKLNLSHLSIITYGIQKTILGHSTVLCGLITNPLTRIILCPNNGSISPHIKFRQTDQCHTKIILAHSETKTWYFLTSMNLEVGLWENFLFEVTLPAYQKQLLNYFNTKWESSHDPTPLPTYDHLLK